MPAGELPTTGERRNLSWYIRRSVIEKAKTTCNSIQLFRASTEKATVQLESSWSFRNKSAVRKMLYIAHYIGVDSKQMAHAK
jgi:hypothetical protein